MRRAALQVFHTARCVPVRRILTPRHFPTVPPTRAIGQRSASSSAKDHGVSQILQSSMYFRTFSVAALVSLFASGVYYYKGDPTPDTTALVNNTSSSGGGTRPALTPALGISPPANGGSNTLYTPSNAVDEAATPPTQRKALVVEGDQFYTRDISDDAPLSKQTDAQGQQQLEMLTPDQATEKLRRTEESYLIGRGRGVIRYDVVQIPSNNPIEDDHAEKIVEVPQSVTPAQDGSQSTDWMFWGVFDGHRWAFEICHNRYSRY